MSKLTLIALAATVCVTAQDRPLVFHVGAELVVLDVIATDANGREVSDLTAAEVQIQEDGSLRPVQHLQLVSRALQLHDRGVPAGAAQSGPTPSQQPVPVRRAEGLSVVIVVDLNSMPSDVMPRVRSAILEAAGGTNMAPTMIVAIREQRDAQSYYLVGYEPLDPPRKSAFREVKITTPRRDVTLRNRRGYYAMSERERAGADVDLAMRSPGAFRHTEFVVSTDTVERTLQIDVRIPSTAIRIRPNGANERATFTVHAELRSTTGRARAKTLPGKDVVLELGPERMNAIRASDKVAVRLDSPAPSPGTYVLTVVARDSGGWIAADTSEVVVQR